jgi:hypothetical protein
MKNRRLFVLCFILLASALSACGPSESPVEDLSPEAVVPTETTVAKPTRTPEPEPTDVPICPFAPEGFEDWTTILCEDFSAGEGYWGEETSSDEYADYSQVLQDGKYVFTYRSKVKSGFLGGSLRAVPVFDSTDFALTFTTEVDSMYKQCGWGVIFREANGDYYFLRFQRDGAFALEKYASSKWDVLIPWKRNSAIKMDQENTTTVVAQGDQFDFYNNGTLLASYNDSSLSGSVLYIAVTGTEGADFTVTFDNLVVQVP